MPANSRENRPQQIPFELPATESSAREDFVMAPANEAALAQVDAWPNWTAPWLGLYGPGGCGKSHLAKIWAAKAGARICALESLTTEGIPELLSNRALVIEAEEGLPFDETALFHAINFTKEEDGHLLLTSRTTPSAWTVENEHLRSRLRAMPVAEIGEPGDELLAAVLVKLFQDRQIKVGLEVVHYLTVRMERSLTFAGHLVERLDHLALAQHRAVTKPLAAQALEDLGVA